MRRAILTGAAALLVIGFSVGAQAATISESLSQSDAAPLRVRHPHPGLKTGMAVLDRRGERVGVITELGQVRDGRPAVTIDANGTPIKVETARLRLTGGSDEAVVSMTRSELLTKAILNTPP